MRLTPAEEQALFERFTVELRDLDSKAPIQLSASVAWLVICQLNLALRHPQNTGPSAKAVRNLADDIAALLAQPGSAMEEVYKRGQRGE